MVLRTLLSKIRRTICEYLGIARYSRPALNDIDRKLEKYLDFEEGFFVEAGANDGFNQSNTYYLEKIKKWSGILIEPIPDLYIRCKKERNKSLVYNCALVPFEYRGNHVPMIYANLMSIVKGSRKSEESDLQHVKLGVNIQEDVEKSYTLSVPVKTLTALLDEIGERKIDLLSLDVEGYELAVLHGLDLDKYRPEYILIEANYPDEIKEYLTSFRYEEVDMLSERDVLYRVRQIN